MPSAKVEEALSPAFTNMSQSILSFRDKCLFGIEALATTPPKRKGASLHDSSYNDFLSHHVITPADKDSSMVPMPIPFYQNEVKWNLNSHHKNGQIVHAKLDDETPNSITKWVDTTKQWLKNISHLIECHLPLLPEPMRQLLDNFLHMAPAPAHHSRSHTTTDYNTAHHTTLHLMRPQHTTTRQCIAWHTCNLKLHFVSPI